METKNKIIDSLISNKWLGFVLIYLLLQLFEIPNDIVVVGLSVYVALILYVTKKQHQTPLLILLFSAMVFFKTSIPFGEIIVVIYGFLVLLWVLLRKTPPKF